MKIKILHILISVSGIDTYLRSIVEAHDSSTFQHIIIHSNTDNDYSNFKSVKEYRINLNRNINPLSDVKSFLNILKIIRHESPDLIHSHSSKCSVFGKLAGKISNTKNIFTPNAFSFLSAQNKIKLCVYLFIEKITLNKQTYLLACSGSELNIGLSKIKIPKERAYCWNNSIKPINENSLTDSDFNNYICTVGRPSFQKNTSEIINAFNLIKDRTNTNLIIAGAGHYSPHHEYIKKQIKSLNLENRIIILGWLKPDDTLSLIKNAKLFISSSRYEGLPFVLIESLNLGTPIVVSDTPGNSDVIKDGYNGNSYPLGKPDELAAKIETLLNNPSKTKEMRVNARVDFEERFNINTNIKKLEKIYTEIYTSNW